MLSLSPLLSPPSPPPFPVATRPSLRPPPRLLLPRAAATERRSAAAADDDDYHATIKSLNAKGRHTPRKSLGQHYMLNSRVNEELASVAGVGEGDVVLEIGPGTGSLTNVLINAGATVVAVEKDPHMAMIIKDRFGSSDQLMILQEDFTKCHFRSHLISFLEKRTSRGAEQNYAKGAYRSMIQLFLCSPEANEQLVVSNIPFNISTDVVKQLLPMGDIFSDVVLLLQDETALRLADVSSQTTECRPINMFVDFYSDADYMLKVERSNFFPQPNVDAAVIRFKLKQVADYPPVASPKGFFSTVNSAFNGKRKMLRKSLQHIRQPAEIEAALRSIGLPVTSRPGELNLDDFVRLHNLLVKA